MNRGCSGLSYVYPATKESSYPTDAIAEVQSGILGDRFMTMRGRNIIIAASVLLSLVFLQISPSMVSGQNPEDPIKSGPYVDKVMFKVITQDDQQVLALYDDEIDLIGDPIAPSFLDTLCESVDVDVANSLRNGYGYLTINCAKYPFNITAFRRALAFALDKEAISDDIWDGLSQPQDSVVPAINPFTIEGQLSYDYYSADIEMGNYLLDKAGFDINETSGYRMAPDGSVLDVMIESGQSSNIALEVCQEVVEALDELHIEASSSQPCYCCNGYRLYFHGNYDIYFLGSTFNSFDVDWLAYDYWSEYADEPFWNFPNFRNVEYDSWRDQLLHSTSYDEVYEAAIEMQKVLVYECPEIVCYENIILSAYRTDKFEGWVTESIGGTNGWWTRYKVHLQNQQGNPVGGTLRISNSLDVDTFNFLVSSSRYAMNVLSMLYDSLLKLGPEGNDVSWLAENYVIETNSDNPKVPEGHTRFTFDILQNATWSDGVPLDAEDIAFSLNYYRNIENSTYSRGLEDMVAVYAMTPQSVVVEFDTESYWHLHTVGYLPIIPKHVFEEIGIEGWNLWNPDPLNEAIVTSGPFNVSDYVAGEYTELTRNPEYFFAVNTSGFETTEEITNPSLSPFENIMGSIGRVSIISWGITAPSVAIIAIVLVKWRIETN